MLIFDTVAKLREHLTECRMRGLSIGLVPTMGALHEGHLALAGRCKAENNVAVCSIYVNPTQFNNPEDLAKYPRTPGTDLRMLQEVACDVVFMPTDAEMYPKPAALKMDFGNLETVMEGKFRPGHFNGVGVVVSKLLHMVQPDAAYFGQKDLQQCLVIKRLVQDLSFPVRLVIHPTVRETDGLAMSSRNQRLTPAQRAAAPLLHQALGMAREILFNHGTTELARKTVERHLSQSEELRLEYFEIAQADDLSPLPDGTVEPPFALCIAAYAGSVRLIDNLLVVGR